MHRVIGFAHGLPGGAPDPPAKGKVNPAAMARSSPAPAPVSYDAAKLSAHEKRKDIEDSVTRRKMSNVVKVRKPKTIYILISNTIIQDPSTSISGLAQEKAGSEDQRIPGLHFLPADRDRQSANLNSFVPCKGGKINEICPMY